MSSHFGHLCRVDAGERENMASKLFQQAKELGIQAKGIQREKFIKEYGEADGPPAVSPKALQLLKEEAVRYESHQSDVKTKLVCDGWFVLSGLRTSCERMLQHCEMPRLLERPSSNLAASSCDIIRFWIEIPVHGSIAH